MQIASKPMRSPGSIGSACYLSGIRKSSRVRVASPHGSFYYDWINKLYESYVLSLDLGVYRGSMRGFPTGKCESNSWLREPNRKMVARYF